LQIPSMCPNVPAGILNPVNAWKNQDDYESVAKKLANAFIKNFSNYQEYATEEIKAGGPKIHERV
jgi:phosphoenolpyruvate carboxykinase (ATP)